MKTKQYQTFSNIIISIIIIGYLVLTILAGFLIYMCINLINNPGENNPYGIVIIILLLPGSAVLIIYSIINFLKLRKELIVINKNKQFSYFLNAYTLKIILVLISAFIYVILIDKLESILVLIGLILLIALFITYFLYSNKIKKISKEVSFNDSL